MCRSDVTLQMTPACAASSGPGSLLSLHCISGCLSPTCALTIQRHFTLVPYCTDSMKQLIPHNVYVLEDFKTCSLSNCDIMLDYKANLDFSKIKEV